LAEHGGQHVVRHAFLAQVKNLRRRQVIVVTAISDEGDDNIVIDLGARKLEHIFGAARQLNPV
jgi:uncharacterized protein YnzC (UPF0291/DUF896 family)